ncbi:hypothetical protein JCM14713_11150 [Desulfomicrobium salsuginis]
MLKMQDVRVRVEEFTKYTFTVSCEPNVPLMGKMPSVLTIEKCSSVVKEGFLYSSDLKDIN